MQKSQIHAVMFHHFHNENHPKGQGSLSEHQFIKILEWLNDRYNLLNADEYAYKVKNSCLDQQDTCLTFDDALLCQSDIVAPILRKRKLQAFFFVHSSPFVGKPDFLEIFRYYRTIKFNSIDDFYNKFFKCAQETYADIIEISQNKFKNENYLDEFAFYSKNDKWFRYLRDIGLGKEKYEAVMHALMSNDQFDPAQYISKLWMKELDIKQLQNDGHTIGLHSFSHPTALHLMEKEDQKMEYEKNIIHLNEILGRAPSTMSHPCGNYSNDTLELLRAMNITLGFRSNAANIANRSTLELPREDHVNILKEIEDENNGFHI